jgi:hypothetical protein
MRAELKSFDAVVEQYFQLCARIQYTFVASLVKTMADLHNKLLACYKGRSLCGDYVLFLLFFSVIFFPFDLRESFRIIIIFCSCFPLKLSINCFPYLLLDFFSLLRFASLYADAERIAE